MHSHSRSALSPLSTNPKAQSIAEARLPYKSFPTNVDRMDQGTRDTTQTSSSGSAVSNISLLDSESPSDDFQRRLLQHARDRRRMRDAVDGDAVHVQAFRKARPRPGVAMKMNGDDANEEDAAGSDIGSSRASSLDLPSNRPSPHEVDHPSPPNVPKQWATKGRQKNNFLRRINSDGPIERPRTPEHDPDVIYKRRTLFTGDSPHSDADWRATAADVPLPTAEPDSPSRMRRSPLLESFRRRRAPRQTSLDLIEELHPDPMGASKDIPTDTLRPRSAGVGIGRSGQTFGTLAERDEAGEQGQSVVAFKSNRGEGVAGHGSNASAAQGPDRPGARRSGSRDLLKQLARATSSTPSPHAKPSQSRNDQVLPQKRSQLQGQRPAATEVDHRLPTPPEDVPALPDIEKRPERAPATDRPQTQANSWKEEGQPQPGQPKSALEAILKSKLQEEVEDALGDSTIASLRDVIGDDTSADLSGLLPLDDETLDLINNVNTRVSNGEEVRQEEREHLRRMNDYLQSARSGVRDASKGLRRVEHQVDGADQSSAGHTHSCDRCGGQASVTLSSLLSGAMSSARDHFYRRSKKGLTFTWLGLACLAVLIWSMLEVSLW